MLSRRPFRIYVAQMTKSVWRAPRRYLPPIFHPSEPRDAAGRGVARAGEVWTRRGGGGFGVGV